MAFDSTAYKLEFNKNNYDRVEFVVPKGNRDKLKCLAKHEGVSVGQLIIEAINYRYGLDLLK